MNILRICIDGTCGWVLPIPSYLVSQDTMDILRIGLEGTYGWVLPIPSYLVS